MKFGQLIECNIKKNFTENHAQSVLYKLAPDLFLEN